MGLREDILKPEKLAPVPFPCEWGAVYLRRFTAAQAADWHRFAAVSLDEEGNVRNPDFFRAKLVQLSCVTKDDELIFKETDVASLTGKSAAVVAQIFAASCELNCLTGSEVARARESFLSAMRNALGSASQNDSDTQTSPSSASG